MKQYRQGDVLLKAVRKVPKGAKKLNHKTVAYGEATGHHHSFEGEVVLMEKEGTVWVVAEEEATLKHQEHASVIVPPGIYEVSIQREYHPQEIRRVAD